MKKMLLLLIIPVIAVAKEPDVEQVDMRQMMHQMKRAKVCMERLDQAAVEEIRQKQARFEGEVARLCKSGKRQQAEDKAIRFETDMKRDPVSKELKRCEGLMKGVMKGTLGKKEKEVLYKKHVCDS